MPDPDAGLRTRLVSAGVDLLASHGPQALSLREIARQAGVSHGAPRRHFPTHQALLATIASEGYSQLSELIANAIGDSEGPPRLRVLALGCAYLDFARANPGMFELMFRHDLLQGNQIGLRDTSLRLFEVLVELVRQTRPDSAQPPVLIAGAIWANLHGIALLRQWGSLRIAVDSDDVDSLLLASVDAHLR